MTFPTDDYYASYELIFHDRPAFSAQEQRFFEEGDKLAERAVDDFSDLDEQTDKIHWRPRLKTA